MPAVPIKTPYGATVHRVFAAYGLQCDSEKDVALFVIRDRTEKVWLWKVLKPEFNEALNAWTFVLDISHKEAETLPKGSYKYGLTFYKDCIYDIDKPVGIPDEPAEEPSLDDEPTQYSLFDIFNGPMEPEEQRMPVDGSVIVPIARKAYVVQEAVAREEGIK